MSLIVFLRFSNALKPRAVFAANQASKRGRNRGGVGGLCGPNQPEPQIEGFPRRLLDQLSKRGTEAGIIRGDLMRHLMWRDDVEERHIVGQVGVVVGDIISDLSADAT